MPESWTAIVAMVAVELAALMVELALSTLVYVGVLLAGVQLVCREAGGAAIEAETTLVICLP